MLSKKFNRAKSYKIQGVTLIELLLVITIISIMASLGLMMLRKNAQDARVNKAALEMQNILQAANNYYVTNGAWPQAYTCGSISTPAGDFVSFLPNANYQSNFGSNYCWNQDGATPRFWVALPFAQGNYQLAQRLAAQLPNTFAINNVNAVNPQNNLCNGTESICYVRTEITQPGASSGSIIGGVAAAGDCRPNTNEVITGSSPGVDCQLLGTDDKKTMYQVHFPCAAGQGHVVAIPNYLNMGLQSTNGANFSLALYTLRPGNNNICTTANGMATCQLNIVATSTYNVKNDANGTSITNNPNGGRNGYVGASYIGYCRVAN